MLHASDDYKRIQDPEGKIPDDEPVFLIRGQDAVGSLAVLSWANLNDGAGGDPELSRLAREQADRMAAWPLHKPADGPISKAEVI